VTCGKFYASFLIQDYFKKYRKRKERERKSKRKDRAASLQVTLKDQCVGFKGIYWEQQNIIVVTMLSLEYKSPDNRKLCVFVSLE